MLALMLLSALLIWGVTILSAAYPFFKRYKTSEALQFPAGESLAAGVFLGAGLLHMLHDATTMFYQQHYTYPIALLICGVTFLFLLWLEHIGKEIYHDQGAFSNSFVILAVIMLSIHSFLAGAALGLSQSLSITLIILLAILAHKWAASFALAVQINKSKLSFRVGVVLFLLFSLMAPMGILAGQMAAQKLQHYTLLSPIFMSLAAGTFLYLGSLHGLEKSVMVKQCCNLKMFSFVILGFAIMALLALYT